MGKRSALRTLKRARRIALNDHQMQVWLFDLDVTPRYVGTINARRIIKRRMISRRP